MRMRIPTSTNADVREVGMMYTQGSAGVLVRCRPGDKGIATPDSQKRARISPAPMGQEMFKSCTSEWQRKVRIVLHHGG